MPVKPRAALLVAIVAVGCLLQCRGRRMELPYAPHRDERFFVDRAVRMAAEGDPNPQWFGHPGSPTIYSLVALYHLREVLAHHGTLFRANPSIAVEFAAEPSGFYMIARYWEILFGTLAIFIVYLLARRLFDPLTALVAAWFLATNPFVAVMCKFARTDGTSLFLAAAAALQIARAMAQPSTRQVLLAGLLVGLGASNKYYLAAYAVGFLGFGRPRVVAMALATASVAFLVAVPFFGPELWTAWRTLNVEVRPFEGVDAITRAARHDSAAWYWYFSASFPRLLGWIGAAVMFAGAALFLRPRRPGRALLLLVPLCFLAACGLPGLRKTYWMVAILPLYVTLMAHAVARAGSGRTWLTALLAVAVSLPSLRTAVARDRVLIGPTPRYQARQWIFQHATPGMLVVQELDNAPWMTLPPGRQIDSSFTAHDGPLQIQVRVVSRLDAENATLERYRCEGVRYLLVNQSGVDASGGTERSPIHRELAVRGQLLAEFPLQGPRYDPARADEYEIGDVFLPTIRIYDIDALPCRP